MPWQPPAGKAGLCADLMEETARDESAGDGDKRRAGESGNLRTRKSGGASQIHTLSAALRGTHHDEELEVLGQHRGFQIDVRKAKGVRSKKQNLVYPGLPI